MISRILESDKKYKVLVLLLELITNKNYCFSYLKRVWRLLSQEDVWRRLKLEGVLTLRCVSCPKSDAVVTWLILIFTLWIFHFRIGVCYLELLSRILKLTTIENPCGFPICWKQLCFLLLLLLLWLLQDTNGCVVVNVFMEVNWHDNVDNVDYLRHMLLLIVDHVRSPIIVLVIWWFFACS